MIDRLPPRLAVLLIILALSVTGSASLALAVVPTEAVSTFPHAGEIDVNVDVLITANFSGRVAPGAVIDESTFRLYEAGARPVPAAVRYERGSRLATMSPRDPLNYGTEYKAVLEGLEDENREWSFKTVEESDHPPGRPRNLRVVANERGNRLSWRGPTRADKGGDFKPPVRGGYIVYRAEAPDGKYEPINKAPLPRTGFTDTEYGRPGNYSYIVRAIDAGGALGAATAPRSNREIKASFVFSPGDRRPVTTANGAVTLEPASMSEALEVSVRTRAIPGAPASPIGPVELTASRPARLKRLSFSVPGDPQGALILRAVEQGWQPPISARHSYDPEGRRVAYGPAPARGIYTVVNRTDRTPPTHPGPVSVRWGKGRPVVAWGEATDPDSGIRGYRLSVSDSSVTAVLNLASAPNTYVDTRPGSGLRYYVIAAVNGAGRLGSAATATVEWSSRPTDQRRSVFCGLCHDGTGSRVSVDADALSTGESCLECHSTADTLKTATWRSRSDKPVAGLIKDGWKGSAHRRATECRTCHKPSASTDSNPAADSLCFQCHGSDKTAGDRNDPHREDGPRCVDCHDVHESDGPARGAGGGNRAQGSLKGVSGVAPLNGDPGTIPSFFEMDQVVYEYQICLKCHSTLAVLFNPANPSHHPVEAPIKERASQASLAKGWKPGATMYCSDCHRVHPDSASRAGPRSADHKPVFMAPFGSSAPPGRENDLCFRCHVREVYEEGKQGSRFSGPAGHDGHVGGLSMGCADCHEVHGSGFTEHLIRITPGLESSGTTAFTHDREGGSCKSSCHERSEDYRYLHAY